MSDNEMDYDECSDAIWDEANRQDGRIPGDGDLLRKSAEAFDQLRARVAELESERDTALDLALERFHRIADLEGHNGRLRKDLNYYQFALGETSENPEESYGE